ncbi:MAG: hypothetical protein EBS16_06230 [Betaproteobacteria bacterium]|nr:hypothetical protein [Betaproteobacteria bacterium]
MIRCADHADIPQICTLLVGMHREAAMKLPPISPLKVEESLRDCIRDGIVFLGFKEKLGGVFALRKVCPWYSDQPFVADMVFYVAPFARKSTLASSLLRHGQRYATICGLPLASAVMSGVDVDRKDHFFTRNGMRRVGGLYWRD